MQFCFFIFFSSSLGRTRDNEEAESVRETVQRGFALAQTTNRVACDQTAPTHESAAQTFALCRMRSPKVRVSKQARRAVQMMCEKEIHPHLVIFTPDKMRANYRGLTFFLSPRVFFLQTGKIYSKSNNNREEDENKAAFLFSIYITVCGSSEC